MRSMIVAAAWLSLWGCGSDDPAATLTITPSGNSGTVAITGPTEFTAVATRTSGTVTWTATGTGALSNTTGLHVTYAPPTGSATGSLTATLGTLSATVQITSSPSPMPAVSIPGLTAAVTVQYDAQDIPHVQCATAADCISVQGYLHARDRLFPMDLLRHTAEGRSAELIGVQGLANDQQFRTLFTTRDGQRLEQALLTTTQQDPVISGLLDAYVRGVNAYIAEIQSGGKLPGEYAQLPFPLTPADIDPWKPEDTLAIARINQFQLSETLDGESANGVFALQYPFKAAPANDTETANAGKFVAWIRSQAPLGEDARTLDTDITQAANTPRGKSSPQRRPGGPSASALGPQLAQLTAWRGSLTAAAAQLGVLRDHMLPNNASVGSNNWVVRATKSATGVAMVANDPHLSLQYPPLFHLSVLTSSNTADNLNLAGGSFPGIPGALVGRGAHVGWGVTVVGYDVTDVYLEQFAAAATCNSKGKGLVCVVRNTTDFEAVTQVPQTFRVRTGPGLGIAQPTAVDLGLLTAPTSVVLVVPHHGPVVMPPKGLAQGTGGTGFSFRWTGHEATTQDLKAFYGLATATNVDTAMDALKFYATGAQNFVLADDSGNIAYDPHALVPVREFADPTKTAQASLQPPWLPVHGFDGTAEWGPAGTDCSGLDAGTIAACWIADASLPQGKNPDKGYFFTANANPLPGPAAGQGDDPGNPFAALGHQPYLSFAWDDSSGFRATQIRNLLNAAITDHGNITLADMQAIQSNHVSRPGMDFLPRITEVPPDATHPEIAAAQGILTAWGNAGFDCPSGLDGTDPKASPAVTDAAVLTNSAGCFLFHAFLRTLLSNVFADDLAVVGQQVNGLSAIKAMLYLLELPQGTSDAPSLLISFCNDVTFTKATDGTVTITTVAKHTCKDQVATALIQAYDAMVISQGADPTKWLWGRVHTMQPVSLLPLVTTNYEPGPFARPGGAFTVDVGTPDLTAGSLSFPYHSGGNVRHISLMDPGVPVVKMQLPGPERDGPTVSPGPDLLGQWVKNTYFDYAFGDQIAKVSVATQSFKAQ